MARTEIGFVPLRLTDAAASDPLLAGLAPAHRVMEWHDDTFDLPDGAVPLTILEETVDRYIEKAKQPAN